MEESIWIDMYRNKSGSSCLLRHLALLDGADQHARRGGKYRLSTPIPTSQLEVEHLDNEAAACWESGHVPHLWNTFCHTVVWHLVNRGIDLATASVLDF